MAVQASLAFAAVTPNSRVYAWLCFSRSLIPVTAFPLFFTNDRELVILGRPDCGLDSSRVVDTDTEQVTSDISVLSLGLVLGLGVQEAPGRFSVWSFVLHDSSLVDAWGALLGEARGH